MIAETTTRTVLVIDDERGPRESLRILLKNDYRVLCADSVDRGLELLQAEKPDIVVMDIRMPGKNGIDGLREIREQDPVVPVIMLTGFGTLDSAQEAIRLGANDYLRKPFDAREMEAVIGRNVQKNDINRRRWRAEQDLQELNQGLMKQLAMKEQLATLGQKSAELVHDLRNPLTAVLGYVELLAQELEQSSGVLGGHWRDASEYLDMIEKNVMRCKELADMWQSLSRRDPQRMRAIAIADLVRDVARGVERLALARAVRIEIDADGVAGEVVGDQLQMFRALQNVIVNAIEAVPPDGGCVRIACRRLEAYVEVAVTDNGCGIEPDQLHRMFEPYFTTKKLNGTGLGLFITKQVVEEHHGMIQIQSRPQIGTSVIIRLPQLDRAETIIG